MVSRGYDELQRGLVLHLPLSEGLGAKVHDLSKYANNGDLTPGGGGEAAFWANTRYGRPVGTFIDDRINCGVDASFDMDVTNALTVAAWVRWGGSTGSSQVIAGRGYDDQALSQQFYLQIDGGVDRPEMIVYDVSENSALSPDAIDVDTWAHLTGTADTDAIKIYVDGFMKDSIGGVTPSASTGQLMVGAWTKTTNRLWLKGRLADLRMYNRVLDPIEVRNLANLRSVI